MRTVKGGRPRIARAGSASGEMTRTSSYLDEKITKKNGTCGMQVVFVDIVSYSRRKTHLQVEVIHAFMKSLKEALHETARQYIEYVQKNNVNIWRDVVVLPSGDGAVVAFPFEGVHDMHLSFALHLLRIVNRENNECHCSSFREHSWCDCHDAYLLRCGMSEGRLILYKDLNDNYNIAGDTVNMAARVMDLAGGSQVFITADAHRQLTQMLPGMDGKFRKYTNVPIKHDLRVDVYQYTVGGPGVDVSPRAEIAYPEQHKRPQDEETPRVVSPQDEERSAFGLPQTKQQTAGTANDVVATASKLVEEMRDRLVSVPPGEFSIGNEQTGRVLVEISHPFLMDKYPITQAIYKSVMNTNPSHFSGDTLPVEKVSWFDAITFCNALSQLSGLEPIYRVIGKDVSADLRKGGYRLPTEAEWEYACLGGGKEDRYGQIDNVAWYNGNSDGQTREVGRKAPNAFGLYDMLGNVWEWCNDWYQKRHPIERQVDYIGPASGLERVLRGGSWRDLPDSIRARYRYRKDPQSCDNTISLRVVRRSE